MTSDEMKLARDGWVCYGRKPARDYTMRAVFQFVERLPNGNVITTDGGRGHVEWSPRSPEKAAVSSPKSSGGTTEAA